MTRFHLAGRAKIAALAFQNRALGTHNRILSVCRADS